MLSGRQILQSKWVALINSIRGLMLQEGVRLPKCRQKVLYGKLRQHLGEMLKDLGRQKDCAILEGHLRPDHISHIDIDTAEAVGVKRNGLPLSGMVFIKTGLERNIFVPVVSLG